MNTELYEAWKQSHQIQACDMDLSDVVMQKITEKVSRPNLRRRAWETLVLNMCEAKGVVQAGLLLGGAALGVIRILFQMVSVLFT